MYSLTISQIEDLGPCNNYTRKHLESLRAAVCGDRQNVTVEDILLSAEKKLISENDAMWLVVRGQYALPANLTTIGGSVDLRGYAHPLPANLTTIGGSVDLRGYAHPLPANLKIRNWEE